MKKILYALMAASLLFACNKPAEQEPTPVKPEPTIEVEEVETLSADAQNFQVKVTATVAFDVVIPEEAAWLKYVGTKAAETKTLEFSVTKNEEENMRQTRVTLKPQDGTESKTFAVMQKAGAGIEISVESEDIYPVEGGTFELKVTSNVPFSASTEADWIDVSVTADKAILTLAPNSEPAVREAEVNFYREGTDKLIYVLKVKQSEPHVILNEVGYADLAAALAVYAELADGPATLTLAAGTHKGDIIIDETNMPLTIEGNGVAVLDGSIEIKKQAATISGLTICNSGEGSLPTLGTSYNYPHGIMLHSAGYGVTITNVTIDMTNLAENATGIFLLSEDSGYGHDIIRSTTVDGGAGHRLMQIYGGRASLTTNTFKNPYSSYAVRIGNENNDVVLASNTFEGPSACGVHFNNLKTSTITLGNGARDNNKFNGNISTPYKANADVTTEGNTFAPQVEYVDGVVNVLIDPNAMTTLTRVWGHYNGSKGDWDNAVTDCSNWNRNAVILGDYVYVTIAGNEIGKYGVAVFSRADGSYVRTITDGFPMEGRFWTSGIVKVPSYESTDIYVSNMAMGDSGQKLQIYRLTDPDSEGVPTRAETVLDGYEVPAGERYGDKMTFWGNDEDGLFSFVSFYVPESKNGQRTSIDFHIAGGAIDPQATEAPYLQTTKGAETGGIYITSSPAGTGDNATRQALYASNFSLRFIVMWYYGKPDGWYQTKMAEENGEAIYSNYSGMGNFDNNALDPRLFYLNGEEYLCYVTIEQDANQRSYGYLRLIRVPAATDPDGYHFRKALYDNRNNDNNFQRYALGDPDDFFAVGHEGTNKTGYCDVLTTDEGDIYILAGITSTGMSLFKVD